MKLVADIKLKFEQDLPIALRDIVYKCLQFKTWEGGATVLIAGIDFEKPNILRTCTLSNSSYFIFRPDKNGGEIKTVFRSPRHKLDEQSLTLNLTHGHYKRDHALD